MKGVSGVLGIGRDSRYSGARRGIGALGGIRGLLRHVQGVGDQLGCQGVVRGVGCVRCVLEAGRL